MKLARDLETRSELFGTFALSSLSWINSGREVVSKTTLPFATTLKDFSNYSNWSFVISVDFDMTETWLVLHIQYPNIC